MGSVWLAEDTRLHREVALKTLRGSRMTDEAGRERLMREARAAAALNHPNIATVHDVVEVDGEVAIVFEHVEGATLATTLADGRLPLERVLQIGIQLAKALIAAHQQGVIHRDLKPSNVIVGKDGDVKVLDFGIARLMPAASTRTSPVETGSAVFLGTPAYAAPEQLFTSAVDERADLYSLGVMLFEMAAGRRPYAGRDLMEVASAKLAEKPPSLSSTGALVPPAFDALVTRLLSQHPADRPASAAEVLGSLRTIAGDGSTDILPARRRARSARWIAAAVALCAAIGGALFSLGLPRASSPGDGSTAVVAVLPLRNNSGDAAKDFLAAGLSESLISSLASSPSLIVLSRTAVADAVKNDISIKKAVSDLGATYVIDGSVQQSGDVLRVAITLVRADQSIAWAQTFDGTLDRVFDLQTRMSLAVSEALPGNRPPAQLSGSTPSNSAQQAYWRGRAFLDRWDVKGNVDAAIAALSEAISEQPDFALAHAAIGMAYWRKYSDTRDQQFAKMAIDAGSKAATLQPNLPEVRLALARSLAATGRTDEALTELRQALALRPTFDEAQQQLGLLLSSQGKIDEAVQEFQKAIALRPKFWGGYNDLGGALFAAGRHADAAKAYEQVVALQPDSYIGFQQLGTSYQALGEPKRAIEAYQHAIAIRPSFGAYSNIGALHHAAGDYERAIEAYQLAIPLRPASAVIYRNLGDSYLRAGRAAEAHAAYVKAVERAEEDLTVNPNDPRRLAALAVYLVKAGRPDDALRRIARARQLNPNDPQVDYRSAVVNALIGRADAALKDIASAIERGYSVRAIQEEEDFTSLRTDRRFVDLTKSTATH